MWKVTWITKDELYHLYNSLTCSTELFQLDDHFCSLISSSVLTPSHWHLVLAHMILLPYMNTGYVMLSGHLVELILRCNVHFLPFGGAITVQSRYNDMNHVKNWWTFIKHQHTLYLEWQNISKKHSMISDKA